MSFSSEIARVIVHVVHGARELVDCVHPTAELERWTVAGADEVVHCRACGAERSARYGGQWHRTRHVEDLARLFRNEPSNVVAWAIERFLTDRTTDDDENHVPQVRG